MSKLLIALAALAATPALAETTSETRSVAHVRFADLDLTTRHGKAELDRRITHAVEAVCPDTSIHVLSRSSPSYRCRRDAFEAVATQRMQALASAAAALRANTSQQAAQFMGPNH